jgi:hypothetical protein
MVRRWLGLGALVVVVVSLLQGRGRSKEPVHQGGPAPSSRFPRQP